MNKKIIGILAVTAVLAAAAVYVRAGSQEDIRDAMDLDRNGKPMEAVAALKGVTSRDPSNFQAYMGLGLVYFRSGKQDDALGAFSKTLQLRGDNPMAYYFMAMIYESKGQKQRALDCWQNFIRVSESTSMPPSEAHRHIGISRGDSIKQAEKHIKMLQEELSNGKK
jgi:cytochrome c-type biogenesis protein CcmH/NrfG